MKFLIQKCNGKVTHDFSFTLLESIRFKNWLLFNKKDKIRIKYINTDCNVKTIDPSIFKLMHFKYVPIGSVEFVTAFLQHFYNITPKPINVPEELFSYAHRYIFNGNHMDFEDFDGIYFVKSNTQIKGFTEMIELKSHGMLQIPADEYQISQHIDILSEWRAFVYQNKLVGLQNYCGDFTRFPNINSIKYIIKAYKSAPIAYTLDIGINDNNTFVIEVHDFFSCGLYGFADHAILPNMFHQWFQQYIQKEMYKSKFPRFCEYHEYTKENPDGTDCMAHLAEARVFKCPYDIKTAEQKCPDYELNKNI